MSSRKRSSREEEFNIQSSIKQCRLNIEDLALVSDQFLVSDRCVSAIATATLKCVNVVSDDDKNLVIDRSKVRRSRDKIRKKTSTERKLH